MKKPETPNSDFTLRVPPGCLTASVHILALIAVVVVAIALQGNQYVAWLIAGILVFGLVATKRVKAQEAIGLLSQGLKQLDRFAKNQQRSFEEGSENDEE